MKKSLTLAIVMFFTAVAAAAAEEASSQARAVRPANGSVSEGIKNDASAAKQGVKNTAHEVKQDAKTGWARFKRAVAVAQCNDGTYSYTHFKTCNHHNGVRQKFW